MYVKAYVHHLRENKVRLVKFDNLGPDCKPPCCDNPAHEHLPGPFHSVEAIHNGIIAFLRATGRRVSRRVRDSLLGLPQPVVAGVCRHVFRERRAHRGRHRRRVPRPLCPRQRHAALDQAQWLITDTPWLGKDSLGVWLSDWAWNSGIGKTRWQEGFIMDLCRGSLLAQIWTDTDFLTPLKRRQLADFIALLKANPECFDNSRFVLGNPWKNEPYGYCCTGGKRAFVAIHNACLKDSLVTLKLGSPWGLPDKDRWDVYPLVSPAGKTARRRAAAGTRDADCASALRGCAAGGRAAGRIALFEPDVRGGSRLDSLH